MHPSRPQESPKEVLAAAKRFAAEGKFEQALENHLWFHHHALDVDESYYGVRLSFALSYWVELGKQYPEALVALREIRDGKTARLLAGHAAPEAFHDVKSIHDHLDESAATVSLFKTLDDTQPEFAASVSHWAAEALMTAGEFGLVRKHMGDPMTSFAHAKQQFAEGLAYAKSSGNEAAARDAFERIFSKEMARMITVLDRTGDPVLSREIQSLALAVLDNPDIRDALDP